MSDWDLVWRWADEFARESEDIEFLQRASVEQGVTSISSTLGRVIAMMAASIDASSIVEVGTGLGVTTMRLAEACPSAHITSIDDELDHHLTLREMLPRLELDPNRLRLITEDALDVLPKMNESSYDFVLIDLPAQHAERAYTDAVALCRPGGIIAVVGVLAGGAVANPANRAAKVVQMRELLTRVAEDDRVDHAVLPLAEGMIWARVHPNTP